MRPARRDGWLAGVDIGAAVRGAVEAGLAKKGGGHTAAAGVTVRQAGMGEFAAYMREAVGASYRSAAASATLAVDGALTPRSATLEFAGQLEHAGPFGQGNPAPRFCLPSVRLTMLKEFSGGHLRCALIHRWRADPRGRLPGRAIRTWRGTSARTRSGLPRRGAAHARRMGRPEPGRVPDRGCRGRTVIRRAKISPSVLPSSANRLYILPLPDSTAALPSSIG